MPPSALAAKVRGKLLANRRNRLQRRHDQQHATYRADHIGDTQTLTRLIGELDIELIEPHREAIAELSSRMIAHEFDLLGSGWTHVVNTRGLEVTSTNRAESERITAILPASYVPIDWHVDFKSGHRWDAKMWFRDQPQVVGRGIDVKVPWELSRMQHLPLLAWGYALADNGQDMPQPAHVYCDEFRGQVLDFMAHNPPRFGINWNCTMDVAIRGAGWALSFDLFCAAGATFDDAFTELFVRSLREHADHIADNLEWDENIRGNHYLADVAGLLIVSAYLPADETTDRYLQFAARELIAETRRQFHEDGSNFEASTSYHRLSAEMAVYGLAALQGVTKSRYDALTSSDWPAMRPGAPSPRLKGTVPFSLIPEDVLNRLARMGRFTQDILDRHDHDPQIGDNDNGRFFKLLPATMRGTDGRLYEDPLNHRHLIDAVDGFFDDSIRREGEAPAEPKAHGSTRLGGSLALPIETAIIQSIIDGVTFKRPDLPAFTDHIAYPGMGLYLYKHGRMTTIVRCGEIGQNGHGGHAHDDQMSFVMYVDGEPVVIDPGTGCYTSDVEIRNAFRNGWQHNAPVLHVIEDEGKLPWEPGIAGLFASRRIGQTRIVESENSRLVCEREYIDTYRRTFSFAPDRLVLTEAILNSTYSASIPIHFAVGSRLIGGIDKEPLRIIMGNELRIKVEQDAPSMCRFLNLSDLSVSPTPRHSDGYGRWQENPTAICLEHDAPPIEVLIWSISIAGGQP